jgi:aminomuconate-semialdehyde/2-hydroxymuconate-6-semialdehyde dehydrogenase
MSIGPNHSVVDLLPEVPAVLSNWIGGEPVSPEGGAYLDNINSATGRIISKIPRSQELDIHAALRCARDAQKEWRRTSYPERAELLEAIANRIEERKDEFAQAESLDTGKPFHVAKNVDISRAIANFRFFAGAIRHDETGCHMMGDAINYTIRKPLGVVALITPWNLPLYLLSWKLAPAIAMGNSIVAKPSELTPTTATLLAEVFNEVGAPKGLYNVVHGRGMEAGTALTNHPIVKAISFTGGTQTGRYVSQSGAEQFKKMSLEMGGKNAALVFDDADMERTVKGIARASFLNQGQICLCASRILVQRGVYEDFVEQLVVAVKNLKVGDPQHGDSDMGSLISHEHQQKVRGFVESALDDGGRILCGGSVPDMPEALEGGAWFQPTIIVDVPTSCKISMEEVFGPVVVVHPFDTEEEAVEIANGTQYGLASTIWTQNLERAHRVAAEMDTGLVWVNTWLHRDLRTPFGGMKNSGIGREGGHYSLDFYSNPQNICISLPR